MNFREKFHRAISSNPQRIAFRTENESISYGDLCKWAEHYAHKLKIQGSEPVVVICSKTVDCLVSVVSCVLAGRAYVPVDAATPMARRQSITEDSVATLVLENMSQLDDLEGEEHSTDNNETAYILFTSGSTGKPKGVSVPYDALDNFVSWLSNFSPLNTFESCNVLNTASFSFDLSVADVYYSLMNGHTLCSQVNKDLLSEDYFNSLSDMEINVAVMVPTFMDSLLLNHSFNAENFPTLRCVYFCGEQLRKQTVRKIFAAFPDITVINAYGPTEATSAVSAAVITPDMAEGDGLLPVGKNGEFATDIEIEKGEIVLKGRSVAAGYVNSPAGGFFTDKGEKCFRTGDFGYFEVDYLFCKGRMDRQIKLGGFRIELDEIEQVLNSLPEVKNSAVVAAERNGTPKYIKAFVEADADTEVNRLKEKLGNLLPAYMIPKSVAIMESLPKNSNGKTDRKALK